ncbi:unannotated protein [freshwater metagenome]|uniref:Unannotated protein n=1 Tax=freshwater metagenome TaxID=449393 RepID=A0A6J7E424_9ZZZZ
MVPGEDRRLQVLRHLQATDDVASAPGRLLEPVGIIESTECCRIAKFVAEPRCLERSNERLRCDDETGRYRQSGPDELAEIGTLASGDLDVLASEVGESDDPRVLCHSSHSLNHEVVSPSAN